MARRWSSQAHEEFPGKFEATSLRAEILGAEADLVSSPMTNELGTPDPNQSPR